MTELQFQKRISNDKNETIFHFCAITNVFSNGHCSQRFDGDVIVNVTTKKRYFSNKALGMLVNDCWDDIVEEFEQEIKELNAEETIDFISAKCEEKVNAELFEVCAELEQVI